MDEQEDSLEQGIAIIGMAGSFPGAGNIEEFWKNICLEKESITHFSDKELQAAGISQSLLTSQNYIKSRGVLEGIELFDADFFNFTVTEAEITDPQHRLFLECAWKALENAGYYPENYSGNIGVYGGTSMSSYFLNNIYPNEGLREKLGEYLLHIGNQQDFLTTRVSYKLNLTGPSITVQTACSTSLVAINTACNHLLTYQCDMALAGGVSITVPQTNGYIYQDSMIFSPDGHCRPFDLQAQGTVPSNGAGIVVLKRLEDALADRDYIYAIIKGYGVNNDGGKKMAFSAPSATGQAKAIISALTLADINPETISFVEAHGTGTFLGDPIEIKALTEAFEIYSKKKSFCAIGSVKGNVGHLIEAAGVTGLIKATLALHNQIIPPTVHCSQENPNINFKSTPFYINTELKSWEASSHPRRASVSSFGFGGTNAHTVLEEFSNNRHSISHRKHHLCVFSARTNSALERMISDFKGHVKNHPEIALADIAYTLQIGRQPFAYRQAVVINELEQIERIKLEEDSHSIHPLEIVFLFPGTGNEYINMGRELYETEPMYRQSVQQCCHILQQYLHFDLEQVLFSSPQDLDRNKPVFNQKVVRESALFITEYALASLLLEWGLSPHNFLGEGLGKYVIECITQKVSIEEALKCIATQTLQINENDINCLQELSDLSKLQVLIGPYSKEKHLQAAILYILPEKNSSIDSSKMLLETLGKLWVRGAAIKWNEFNKYETAYRIPLPTYPFEKKRFWIDPPRENFVKNTTTHAVEEYSTTASIQNTLASIWQDWFGVEKMKLHKDFFALGGDSFIGIQVIAKIRSLFGISIQLRSLLENPTVEQLADIVKQKIDANSVHKVTTNTASFLVKLQPGKNNQSLFLIHPIGGNVFCYHPLVKHLKYSGAIYGVQAADRKGYNSIEELAADYVKEIRSVQAEGPYYLLGASFGGVVAYEIAQQLKAADQTIEMLAMLDIMRPDILNLYIKGKSHLELLIELFGERLTDRTTFARMPIEQQHHQLIKVMGLERVAKEQQEECIKQLKNRLDILLKYRTKTTLDEILYFEAQDKDNQYANISLGQTWKECAVGGMQTHEVMGNHFSMIMEPQVAQIAEIIGSYIQQKQSVCS